MCLHPSTSLFLVVINCTVIFTTYDMCHFVSLFVSLYLSTYLYIPLHFCTFLYISLHPSVSLCLPLHNSASLHFSFFLYDCKLPRASKFLKGRKISPDHHLPDSSRPGMGYLSEGDMYIPHLPRSFLVCVFYVSLHTLHPTTLSFTSLYIPIALYLPLYFIPLDLFFWLSLTAVYFHLFTRSSGHPCDMGHLDKLASDLWMELYIYILWLLEFLLSHIITCVTLYPSMSLYIPPSTSLHIPPYPITSLYISLYLSASPSSLMLHPFDCVSPFFFTFCATAFPFIIL